VQCSAVQCSAVCNDVPSPVPPPADDALCGLGLELSLSSSRLGREMGRGMRDLLERLVLLESVDWSLLEAEPGVETVAVPVEQLEVEPRVHAQLAQCSRFL
jgi:hypothetical protein